jgi:hypothetical protein
MFLAKRWSPKMDPCDAAICFDKCCTYFWGDYNIRCWTPLMKSGVPTLGLPLHRLSSTESVSQNWHTSSYSVFLHGARILGYLCRHISTHLS